MGAQDRIGRPIAAEGTLWNKLHNSGDSIPYYIVL